MKFSKEEILKILENAKDNQGSIPFAIVKKAIEKLEVEPEWTPCSKQLPKKVGDYFVTTHNGQIARYIYMGNSTSKDYWMRCAVAWMPIPKPYKAESEDKE